MSRPVLQTCPDLSKLVKLVLSIDDAINEAVDDANAALDDAANEASNALDDAGDAMSDLLGKRKKRSTDDFCDQHADNQVSF